MAKHSTAHRDYCLKEPYAAMRSSVLWHPRTNHISPQDRAVFLGFMTAVLITCQKDGNDGRIPKAQIRAIAPFTSQDFERAIAAGLDSGYLVDEGSYYYWHDYEQWNQTRAERIDRLARLRAAASKGGKARAAASARDRAHEPDDTREAAAKARLYLEEQLGIQLVKEDRDYLEEWSLEQEGGANEIRRHARKLRDALERDNSLEASSLIAQYLSDPNIADALV